jgi:hypothetical protein
MPLVTGSSNVARNKNIRILINDGYPIKQALAIAYNIQRKEGKNYFKS